MNEIVTASSKARSAELTNDAMSSASVTNPAQLASHAARADGSSSSPDADAYVGLNGISRLDFDPDSSQSWLQDDMGEIGLESTYTPPELAYTNVAGVTGENVVEV